MLFFLLIVAFQVINSSKAVLNFYLALFASSAIIVTHQLLRVFLGVDFLSFGILNSSTSTLLGRWNDLSILLGLLSLISVTALEFFNPAKIMKILLYFFTALSLVFMVVVNSVLAWFVLGILSLLLFIYLYLQRKVNDSSEEGFSNRRSKFSKLSALLFIIAVVFVIIRPQVGEFVSSQFNISQIEARPSFSSTLSVASNVLSQSPGFGAGPNRFSIEWGTYKPLGVNNTIFWNVNFNYGIGIVPTSLISYGVLGFTAWIFFLGALLFLGMKALFTSTKDPISRFVIVSSFLGSLYLWVFSTISVPGVIIMTITYLMTGIFLASCSRAGLIKYRKISFADDSKIGFSSVFVLVLILILNISFGYLAVTRYMSVIYTQKALIAVNETNNLDLGLKDMNRSISLAKTDNNYRLISQLHVARLNELLIDESLAGTEEGTRKFQDILGLAISSAQSATEIDGNDYRNWLALGNIYEAIIPLGIDGAYESAKATYERAGDANPTNPSIDLALARLEVSRGDNDAARIEISNSLRKKNNYTDAIFLLSQIEINEGNITQAIEAVEAASIINPNDSLTFFQLGFLKFNQGDFEGSTQALERAVALTPPYSNARYFLGLSYYNTNQIEEAILQFEEVSDLNPDNEEVKLILENLRNGDQPFLNAEGTDPETRDELPVPESQ